MALRSAAPTMKSQKRIAKKLDALKEGATDRMNTVSGPYPFVAFAPDSRDNRYHELTSQIQTGVAPYYRLTEDDLDYAITRKQQIEQLQFDKWAWNMYDQRNPAIRQWYKDHIDSGMYDRMVSYLNGALENTKRFSRINMMGPSNKEDLEFVYAIQQGKIHIPESFDPKKMTAPMPESTRGAPGLKTDELGVFNPVRWFTDLPTERVGYSAVQYNPFGEPLAGSRSTQGVADPVIRDTMFGPARFGGTGA